MKKFSELFSAFDYIDEIIYICDMDNYDLVYCNQKMKGYLQPSEYKEDQPGYKCYKCLQKLDQPCVFCNNETLKKNKRCIWTRQNPHAGRYYLLHDSVITIDGKDYRMELAVDATHLEESAAHTRQMLDAETHLTDCVRNLLKSGNFSDSVAAVLQTVLNYYGGERAYLFELDWEKNEANNTYEICAPGITAQIDNLQHVPLEVMHVWMKYFVKQEAMIIEDLETLKEDPFRQEEYEDLHVQGINSIIAVPVFSEDELTGFVGVDNPSLNFGNTDFLVNLVYFIGTEIKRNQMMQRLQDLSFRDPLTGVYNRKGFEEIVKKQSGDGLPIGFAVVDVDNFKMINDTYGHDIGDEILKETANMLVGIFRSEDTVFRLGGDEFAILLSNCEASAWKTICSKIQWIHSAMAEKHKERAVTLSVGVCFSTKAYSDRIYSLADDALYETKRNGRAGCTMIDEATGKRRYWSDHKLTAHNKNALENTNTGVYRFDYPLETRKTPRLICSDAAREIFAFPIDAGPEECYELWIAGIEPAYMETLIKARLQMLKGDQTECTYLWKHPKFGKIFIRTIGTSEIVDGVQTVYGYHHSMKNTKIIERENESRLLLEAISSIYFGSYYINLENDTYVTIKNAPNERFLQVEEKNAAESLRNYVYGLVRSEEQEKMLAFVDLQTLQERLTGESHLDCEYVSVVEKDWCRATFIPVKYTANGQITHVMFAVAPLDVTMAQESDANLQNKKTIESLYNQVPGGLVLYEWNGKQLKTLQISKYYEEQYGETLISRDGSNIGGPNFDRVHPDDLADYQKAIKKALTETHYLEYVYRAWNNRQNRYVWVKMSAVSEIQKDGTSLVYAMYSDVTGQKEAELRLLKKQASLDAALSASSQLCYEYDPQTHIEECLTEDQIFHLPKVIENYPDALIEMELVYPDDQEILLQTIHRMEQGAEDASCKARLKKDDKYVWYSFSFHSFYDTEKGRNIIIFSVMDVSEHMETVKNYEARMQMMMGVTEEALSFGAMNLTENTFTVVHAQTGMRALTDRVKTFEELFQNTVRYVIGERQQEKYRKLFSRENLLALMEQGQMHVHMDHMYQMSPTRAEWVRTCVDMLKNPFTGDVVGVCYSKSIQNEKITNMLLDKTLQRDYPLAAIVYMDNEEYYLFHAKEGQYCVQKQDFWQDIVDNLPRITACDDVLQLKENLRKERILDELQRTPEYSFAFDGVMNESRHRLEAKFSYLDENHEMLLATLRDITDSMIIDKLRHDNERDHLTNLYNRRKTYAVCRQLLEQHPEDQFAMLHFDIRHFRLYNTFFGDVAGDKLLCDIADMFRKMDCDYEYWAYGRIESDVFCVLFPINQNKYQKHLDDLLHGLQDYRTDFLIEPAIGIYIVKDRSMPIESMFTRASIAAKTVRTGVTNSVIFYNEAMEHHMAEEQQVINDMQTALEQEQFQVYLQPKYSLRYNKPVGAEALVRWIHPQKGLISPVKFVPVFERNGFIAELDRYMWEHVCRLLRKWKDAGYVVAPVSVNVSRISMYNPTTVRFLKELVKKYELEPEYLELELTESAYMDDPEEMKKQLKELQEYGFHILMDDFGSGYSSLNTLRELPVDCLKLDTRFLSESSTDERGQMVLASVVRMSKMLRLTIIAEGVETREQAEFLRNLGCEYAQGFLFARPMPSAAYEQLLKTMELVPADMQSQVMEDSLPMPVASIKYEAGEITYLRINALLVSEFGIKNELHSLPEIFREHLSEEDHRKLLQAYAACAETKETVRFKFSWRISATEQHLYIGRVADAGVAGNAVVLLAAFMDAEL